ncbi:hypothetical protein lbkm_4213 [Lachnospiraceae bacterium KM106-2]|nr:hypothetical protein lbkm_4213 [Lachnospiraceae bacterium KM106-2]
MLDEDFLNRKPVVWYKRVLIGSVILGLMIFAGLLILAFQ